MHLISAPFISLCSFEPEEQINGALHQSYIEQAAKRSGDTSRAGADNSALNSTVYDKHYNDANPLFPMFNFNKVSSNKTDKQVSVYVASTGIYTYIC